MKIGVILAITATGLFCSSSTAWADQRKPLRHLVYQVGVTVSTQTEIPTGDISGAAHYASGMRSHGTMTADIMGFTADDAFAIQISEQTDNRKAPSVRVDVTADGGLRIKPDDVLNVTEEEEALLRVLARKFLSQDGLLAGKWIHQLAEDRASIHEEYRITGVHPNGDVLIALDQQIKMGGAQPFDTTTHGMITYSMPYSVPRSISLDGRTHHEGPRLETDDTKVNLELLTDSFQSRS